MSCSPRKLSVVWCSAYLVRKYQNKAFPNNLSHLAKTISSISSDERHFTRLPQDTASFPNCSIQSNWEVDFVYDIHTLVAAGDIPSSLMQLLWSTVVGNLTVVTNSTRFGDKVEIWSCNHNLTEKGCHKWIFARHFSCFLLLTKHCVRQHFHMRSDSLTRSTFGRET